MKFQNPLDVSEELDNRITIQLLNSHTTYTSSLTFEDVNNLSLDTLQIKGGTSGVQIIDFNNNSLMDLDNPHISINKPLVYSSTGYFTGKLTASKLYDKPETDTMIGFKQDITTELTNLLSMFDVGSSSLGIKSGVPDSSTATLDIDNAMIVRGQTTFGTGADVPII